MTVSIICISAGIILLAGWLFLHYCPNKAQFGKRLLLNTCCGIGTMTIMNALAGITQLSIPVNALSLGTGLVLGAPGMLGLYAIKLFM